MLDRNIPFYNTILRCDTYQRRSITLPYGYSFSPYKAGYEKEWTRLEYSIGDFDSTEDAENYFKQTYMRDMSLLSESAVFLLDQNETVIGSCIAWRDYKDNPVSFVSSLHWLIIDEQYQGNGLGKLLCGQTMDIFAARDKFPVYIHTQPWSWKAILLYLSLGFRIQKTDSFSDYTNQYDQAMTALKAILSEEQYKMLLAYTDD